MWRDGWVVDRQSGRHVSLKHPTKPGLVVVPNHRGTMRTGTIASITADAGLTAADLANLL